MTVRERSTEPSEGNAVPDRRSQQEAVVVAELARGASYGAAASSAGVATRTVARWMSDAEFRRRVSDSRCEVTSEIVGRLVAASHVALDAIHREMSEAERSADRLRAASLWLSLQLRFRESSELEDRVRELEAQVHGQALNAPRPEEDDE